MKVSTDKNLINEALTRSVDKIYPTRAALEKELLSGRRLRIYLGVDPTGSHLHLGHATNLLTLRRFQELGHEIILLIGDFTARIGDPTDKLAPRQPLIEKEIKDNLKTFKTQAAKIIGFSGANAAKIEFNSKWLKKMVFTDVLELVGNFTVQQMLERDMFQRRLSAWICPTCKTRNILDPSIPNPEQLETRCPKCGWYGTLNNVLIEKNKPINIKEFLYPLMQGYDSVAMDVDMEIGGTDQTFNMLVGRTLIKTLKNKEKFVIITKLLIDPETNKKIMNKSEGGLVNLDDEPNDMFGKVMALQDSAIIPVAEFSTDMPLGEVQALTKEENPKDAKLRVAYEVVKTYHSAKDADKAKENWIKTFSNREVPEDAKELKVKKEIPIMELLLASGVGSKSEARRLIQQKAVKINDIVKENPDETLKLKGGEILKVGKHRFFKLTLI